MKKIILCCLLAFGLHAEEHPVVIVGSGIAALTAAIQVSQAGITPLVITGISPGGIILQSHSVQNWPGEVDISGVELADRLQKHAEKIGVRFLPAVVTDIDVQKRPFVLTTQNPFEGKREKIVARTCILALGSFPKLLHVKGEDENLFVNIFTCAPCDGLQFKNKTVAIIGGGDSALTEAQYLSNLAKKVYLIVRKSDFKTIQPEFKKQVLATPNVQVLFETAVKSFTKTDRGLILELTSSELVVDGAFLAIGSIPNTQLLRGKVALDDEGYVVLNNFETSVPGIFAAGDVSDKEFKQATTAAGSGTIAGLKAVKALGNVATSQKQLSKAGLVREINSLQKTFSKPTAVYVYGTFCSPCRAFRFIYEEWAERYQDKADFVKIDSVKATELFTKYHFNGIPTVLLFNTDGKLLHKATGSQLGEIAQILDQDETASQN